MPPVEKVVANERSPARRQVHLSERRLCSDILCSSSFSTICSSLEPSSFSRTSRFGCLAALIRESTERSWFTLCCIRLRLLAERCSYASTAAGAVNRLRKSTVTGSCADSHRQLLGRPPMFLNKLSCTFFVSFVRCRGTYLSIDRDPKAAFRAALHYKLHCTRKFTIITPTFKHMPM